MFSKRPFVPSEVEGHGPGAGQGVSTSLDTNGKGVALQHYVSAL